MDPTKPILGLQATPGIFPGPTGVGSPTLLPMTPTAGSVTAAGAATGGNPLMKILAQAAQPRPQLMQPMLAPLGKEQGTVPPAYMQRGPAWGPERFLYSMSATVHNAVLHEKQQQVAAAMNDWRALDAAYERSGGNMQKLMQDPAAQAILGDPKKLKHLAKALNEDWLNPEKTTVYQEAKKKYLAEKMSQKQAQAMAFRDIHGKLRQQFMQEMAQQMPVISQTDPAAIRNLLSEQGIQQRGDIAQQQHIDNLARILSNNKLRQQGLENQMLEFQQRMQMDKDNAAALAKDRQIMQQLAQQRYTGMMQNSAIGHQIDMMRLAAERDHLAQTAPKLANDPAVKEYFALQAQYGRYKAAEDAAVAKGGPLAGLMAPRTSAFRQSEAEITAKMQAALAARPDVAKALGVTPHSVTMLGPDGKEGPVQPDEINAALAHGYKVVP